MAKLRRGQALSQGAGPSECRSLIDKPTPLHRDCSRDPNIQAFEAGGCVNHGSTLRI